MRPFGPPNVKKLEARGDVAGLIEALCHRKLGAAESDPGLFAAAREALARIGDPAVEALAVVLEDANRFWRDREAVIAALGEVGGARAAEALTSASRAYDSNLKRQMGSGVENERLRAAAAAALAKSGAPAVARHEDVERKAAAKELRAIKSSRDVDFLVAELKYHYPGDSQGKRAAAAGALGQLGDARAVEPLIAALESRTDKTWLREEMGIYDGKESLLKAAAKALGQLGDSRAVEPLIDTLENRSPPFFWGARPAAARALGQLGDARAVEALKAALENDDDDLRQAAAWALRKIEDAQPDTSRARD